MIDFFSKTVTLETINYGSSGKLVLFRIKPLRGDTDLNDANDFHGFEFLFFAWLSMDSIIKKDRL